MRLDCIAGTDVGGDVGTTEAVYGLLGIADEEQGTRPDPVLRPVLRIGAIGGSPHSRQKSQLERIGVLEFIY